MAIPYSGPVTMRRATQSDHEWIFALVPRLVEFGPPPWRDAAGMRLTDRKVIERALASETEDPIVFVALSENGGGAGFIHLHSVMDYYTERKNGHVADLVVAEAYERRGIGRQLLARAEAWAHAQQFEFLTISVFPQNARAARMYENWGFHQDRITLLKPLR